MIVTSPTFSRSRKPGTARRPRQGIDRQLFPIPRRRDRRRMPPVDIAPEDDENQIARARTLSLSSPSSSSRARVSSLEDDRARGWCRAISGTLVKFPLASPYPMQIRVIECVIRAMKLNANALIESPTGSGKTLALLCAALARAAFEASDDGHRERTEAKEDEKKKRAEIDENVDGRRERMETKEDEKKKLKIYYATRTHTQIEQCVKELKRTEYRPKMVVLASKEHYCVNAKAKKTGDVNGECRRLMDESVSGRGCYCAGAAAVKLASHAKTSTEAMDIEDLVRLGKSMKGCPYFASRILAEDAELVFAPYNYLLDPRTRAAMDIDVEGSVIIFDEGHNIEDTSREAASEEVTLEEVAECVDGLTSMCSRSTAKNEEFEVLRSVMHGLYSWFVRMCDDRGAEYVLKQDTQLFETWGATLRGEHALAALAGAGVTRESVGDIMRALSLATKYNQDLKDHKERVSGTALNTCEKVLNPLKFMLSNGETTARDYRILLEKTLSQTEVLSTQAQRSTLVRLPIDEVVKIDFRCLNPALAFRDLVGEKGARSVILTSGTLAPLNSFASELGVDFPIRMEAPHCVDMHKQVWGCVIASGPNNQPLNAGFKSRNDWTFQDELGSSVERWAKIVPHGMLMFFPSYSLMDTIVRRWRDSGVWKSIESASGKKIFQEPTGKTTTYGNQKKPAETLEQVLEKYYKCVADSVKSAPHPYAPAPENARGGRGAILLAVCRGKISEGIDFADANARAVICVGIPYPNYKDPMVQAKRSYNDEGQARGLLSGQKWYDQQAFRALNQAVGRCLRHRFDHGAIMLVDERFGQNAIQSLPKWLRGAMQHPTAGFEQQLASLTSFFDAHAENPPGEDEPASKSVLEDLESKRKRPITEVLSPRKASRYTPITAFFSKASTSKTESEDSVAHYAVQFYENREFESIAQTESLGVTTTEVPPRNSYQAPEFDEFEFDDGLDWDAFDMPPPPPRCAKEPPEDADALVQGNVDQILDGIEWDDEDDTEEWCAMVRTTQAEFSISQQRTRTESNIISKTEQVVTSPIPTSLCLTCGRKPLATLGSSNVERITLKSRYFDEFGIWNFVVAPSSTHEGWCCGQESNEATFDAASGMAFRPLFSCDNGKVIGFKVEATNVANQRLIDSVLLRDV